MTIQYNQPEPPSQTAWPVARAGFPYIFTGAFVTAILALLGFKILTLVALVATLGVCFFFRDPDRVVPVADQAVVSPADGKVIIARREEANPYFPGPCMKISIFMTVFNVHVNRASCAGEVEEITYVPGKFLAADKKEATLKNERNAVSVRTEDGHLLCIVQVAGLIARRIICSVQKGQKLARGQRFGLICFGSRLDVYLPPESRASVSVGDKVKAGTSVLGYLP